MKPKKLNALAFDFLLRVHRSAQRYERDPVA
jgi:hypothetical protein